MKMTVNYKDPNELLKDLRKYIAKQEQALDQTWDFQTKLAAFNVISKYVNDEIKADDETIKGLLKFASMWLAKEMISQLEGETTQ